MTAPIALNLAEQVWGTGDDDDRVHIVAREEDERALCGEDVSDATWRPESYGYNCPECVVVENRWLS